MTINRPVLRYHGGKWRLAPWIVAHFPPHRVYIEPFAGAASVLLRKNRAVVEVLNDLNDDVVNLFRVLRDPVSAEALRVATELTPYSRGEWEHSWHGAPTEPIEAARRYLLRSWATHGATGVLDRNRAGFRRSPRCHGRGGSHPAADWARWPASIPAIVDRLRGVVVEHRPALDVIHAYDDADALIYVDPPYLHSTRRRPDHVYAHEMTADDHAELAAVLRACRGTVVISGYRSKLYSAEFEAHGWSTATMAARADHGLETEEVLWISPNGHVQRHLFEVA